MLKLFIACQQLLASVTLFKESVTLLKFNFCFSLHRAGQLFLVSKKAIFVATLLVFLNEFNNLKAVFGG